MPFKARHADGGVTIFRGTVATIEGRNVSIRDVSRRVQRHFVSSDATDIGCAEYPQEGDQRSDNRNTVVGARPAAVGWRAQLFRGNEKDFERLEVAHRHRRRRGGDGGLPGCADQATVAR